MKHPSIDITGLRKYSKRRFKSKRLRKKQISTLGNAYIRLARKHKCWMAHASVTGDIPPVEWWMFCIETIAQTVELVHGVNKRKFHNPYENDNTPTRQYKKIIGE